MMSSVINRAAIKKMVLAEVQTKRPHLGITRVSKEAVDRYVSVGIQSILTILDADIHSHPTIGKTFKP